jgi:hypothetical protein
LDLFQCLADLFRSYWQPNEPTLLMCIAKVSPLCESYS